MRNFINYINETRILEKEYSPIKYFFEHDYDTLNPTLKNDELNEYVKTLFGLDEDLEYYYESFFIDAGILNIQFDLNMFDDIYNLTEEEINEYEWILDRNTTYECDIDELEYYISDINYTQIEKITQIFKTASYENASINQFSEICTLMNKKYYTNIENEINSIYTNHIIEKAKEIDKQYDFYFDLPNISIRISSLSNIKTITELLKDKKTVEKISEIEDIKNTMLTNVENNKLITNITNELTLALKFFNENKDEVLNIIYEHTELIIIYSRLGGDFNDILKTNKFQDFYINHTDKKVNNYMYLRDNYYLNNEIINKYKYLITVAEFNI